MSENPYSTPQTAPELLQEPNPAFQIVLASRWARLGASMIDGIILLLILATVIFPLAYFDLQSESSVTGNFLTNYSLHSESIFEKAVDTVLTIVIYLAINGYLMVKSGQTIGKKALGIQVVSYHTRRLLSPAKIIGMRFMVTSILNNIPIFMLVDALFIFSAEKRCVHDHMAGSIVIKKNPAL